MSTSARKRIAFFLGLSLLFHLLFVYGLSRVPRFVPQTQDERAFRVDLIDVEEPKPEDRTLVAKKPKLFDMMEVEEALSEVPASLSQSPETPRVAPETSPPPVPPAPARKPEPETAPAVEKPLPEPRKPPVPRTEMRQDPPKERPAEKSKARKPQRATPKAPPPDPALEEPPSVRDLIPSINDILAMRAPGGSLYRHDTVVQDGIGERQAKAAFDEYLAEFKSRVRLNWKVLDDPYMHESTAVLLIVIRDDGTLESVRKLQSSGMPGQDTQTLYAVRNSFPMRPPPKVLLDEDGRLTIHFSFHFLVRSVLGDDEIGRPALRRQAPPRQDPGCVPPCFRW